MSESDRQARMRESWHEVAERFSALGRSAKERYRGGADGGGDGDADGGDGGDRRSEGAREADTAAALKAALDQLVAAGRELGERVADVARDDDLRAQAKQTSSTLDEALTATVDLIEEQVNSLLRRSKGSDEPGDWDPPTGPPV